MKKIKRILLCILMMVLMISYLPVYAEDDLVIHIQTADDLVKLAEECALDTYSKDITVVLENDISLAGSSFVSIPSFAGTFDGGGHTINDYDLDENIEPAGFISILENSGKVVNLTIKGNIILDSNVQAVGGIVGENYGVIENSRFIGSISAKQNIGGIAGINAVSGTIRDCIVKGSVFGKSKVGGISGYNLGLIETSKNYAFVNTDSYDPSLDLSDINLDSLLDISSIKSLDTKATVTDVGGISGYSNGIIQNCDNLSTIGYQHIGYNIGGITGRSSGHIFNCTNLGVIYGRKDVGGITGHMEPYISADLSEDVLKKLKTQLNDLHYLVNKTINNTDSSVNSCLFRLNSMSDYIDSASASLSSITITGSFQSSISGNGSNTGLGNLSFESSGVEGGGNHSVNGSVDASTQITVNTSLHQLSGAISGIAQQTRLLNHEVSTASGTLSSNLKSINNKVNELSNTLFDSLFSSSTEIVTDVSMEEIDSVVLGKILSCTNEGEVHGDINVAGIAGVMGIEVELDPEDDLVSEVSNVQRKQYELKAIIQNCKNSAAVSAKRSYVGNITGQMNLGLITNCFGYGNLSTENGDYVGGVSGTAKGTIQECTVRCALNGNNYVGGIIGKGMNDEGENTGSVVKNCTSIVHIINAKQYFGAIAGIFEGTFVNNYYVSDQLAAINRISYTGMAEPVTYEHLQLNDQFEEELKQCSLQFVVDGEVIQETTFDYGASFDESIYPEVPFKEGYLLTWSETDLTELKKDTVVEAIFVPYTTSLISEDERNKKPIFLVNGSFSEGNELTVDSQAITPSQFHVLSYDFLDSMMRGFQSGKLNLEVIEQWEISIPETEDSSYEVRYLSPNEKVEQLSIYAKKGDEWEEVETDAFGSYLSFETDANIQDIAVVSTFSMWIIYAVLAVIALIMVLLVYRKLKVKKNLNMSAIKIDKKKSSILAGIILIVFAGIVVSQYSNSFVGIKAYQIVENSLEQPNQTAKIEWTIKTAGNSTTTNSQIDRFELEGNDVVLLTQNKMKFYFVDHKIILENGKSFQYDEGLMDYVKSMQDIIELYQKLNIEEFKNGNSVSYHIHANEREGKEVLDSLIPELSDTVKKIDDFEIVLNSVNNELKELLLYCDGITVQDDASFDLEIEIEIENQSELQLNDEIISAIHSTDSDQLFTADLLTLVKAYSDLIGQKYFYSDLNVNANFGPVVFNDSFEFDKMNENYTLSKNDVIFHYSKDRLTDASGHTINSGSLNVIPFDLVELIYDIAMNSTFEVIRTGDEIDYLIALDEKDMHAVLDEITPVISKVGGQLTEGNLVITVKGEKIARVKMNCYGKMKVVTSDVDISFELEWLLSE